MEKTLPAKHAWNDRSGGGGEGRGGEERGKGKEEGVRDPQGRQEERRRASSRENSPQAHMAEMKHPYAGVKQKTVGMLLFSVSHSLFLWK